MLPILPFLLTLMITYQVYHQTLNSVQKARPVPPRVESSAATTTPSVVVALQPTVGLPTRLIIPRINVSASVEYVGLTADGAMAVPKGPSDVAWFSLGVRPGEKGSAVIAGHEGWKNDIPAVFDDLSKLQKGDEVYVEDETGATATFVVRDIRTYGENGNASDVFISNDGKAHLNLITCEGIWNAAKKSYSNRLVVFTDKV